MNLNESILERTFTKKRDIMEVYKQRPWIFLNFCGAAVLGYYL